MLKLLNLFTKDLSFFLKFGHRLFNIAGIAQHGCDTVLTLLQIGEQFVGFSPGNGFYTAHTCGHAAFSGDFEHADIAGIRYMGATAQFHAVGRIEHDDTNLIAVFLSKKRCRTQGKGIVYQHFAVLGQVYGLTDFFVHPVFNLLHFLIGHFREMRKVKAQTLGADVGTLLGHMVTQHHAQSLVQQVSGGVQLGSLFRIVRQTAFEYLVGTGLGHVNKEMYPAIERAHAKGVHMFMTLQTIWGYVHMFVYDTGRDMMAKGIIPAGNMLPEVAWVKLSWVLGQTDDPAEVKRMMLTPVNDEITEREPYNGYLVYQGGIPDVEEFVKRVHK